MRVEQCDLAAPRKAVAHDEAIGRLVLWLHKAEPVDDEPWAIAIDVGRVLVAHAVGVHCRIAKGRLRRLL